MYQWSWAFKYASIETYENYFDMPSDWMKGTPITLYTDSGMSTQITNFSHITNGTKIYANEESIYLDYLATGNVPTQVTLTGKPNSQTTGKYKKAAYLPEDFIGYLSCYTNDQLTILGDYITDNTNTDIPIVNTNMRWVKQSHYQCINGLGHSNTQA